jgi:hypothetical protein
MPKKKPERPAPVNGTPLPAHLAPMKAEQVTLNDSYVI